jgi:hypothetical protein
VEADADRARIELPEQRVSSDSTMLLGLNINVRAQFLEFLEARTWMPITFLAGINTRSG